MRALFNLSSSQIPPMSSDLQRQEKKKQNRKGEKVTIRSVEQKRSCFGDVLHKTKSCDTKDQHLQLMSKQDHGLRNQKVALLLLLKIILRSNPPAESLTDLYIIPQQQQQQQKQQPQQY